MKHINIKNTIICLSFFLLAGLMISGVLQTFVNFRALENEIGFTLLSAFGGSIFLLGIKK